MLSWRDHILKEFPADGPPLTLAEDPDCLLTEEEIAGTLRERGYELITYDDPVAFRFHYESQYRRPHAVANVRPVEPEPRSSPLAPRSTEEGSGGAGGLVVRTEGEVRALPYDLLHSGRALVFGLGDLFPALSFPVIAELRPSDLDALYQAQRRHKPTPLGRNATRDFVLRHVFDIAPEVIKGPPELLHALLRRHYREQRVPSALDEYLIDRLRQNPLLDEWPLERIVPERAAFLAFLQERWPIYLEHLTAESGGEVREASYALVYPGPAVLPLDHRDVRVRVGDLFRAGSLQPLPHPAGEKLAARGHWAVAGIDLDPGAGYRRG